MARDEELRELLTKYIKDSHRAQADALGTVIALQVIISCILAAVPERRRIREAIVAVADAKKDDLPEFKPFPEHNKVARVAQNRYSPPNRPRGTAQLQNTQAHALRQARRSMQWLSGHVPIPQHDRGSHRSAIEGGQRPSRQPSTTVQCLQLHEGSGFSRRICGKIENRRYQGVATWQIRVLASQHREADPRSRCQSPFLPLGRR